jgi:hypothetical protein
MVTAIITGAEWSFKKRRESAARRVREERLHRLTHDEKTVLLRFLTNPPTRTARFIGQRSIAQGLADDGILYKPDIADLGNGVSYNILNWALDYLAKHRDLL